MSGGRRAGLGPRLLVAIAAVLGTAGFTTWLVAGAIGPSVFRDHLAGAPDGKGVDAVAHAENAFSEASAIALAVGLTLGAVAALTISALVARRVGASLVSLARAVREIAGGRLDARVPSLAMGPEFDDLTRAFNQMAGRLEASERLRHRLLSDVAHELRTPVAAMNANLESLEDGVTVFGPETITLLRRQGARLTRLSEDLAAVTRAQSGELAFNFGPVSTGELLSFAYLVAKDRAERAGVDLVLTIGHDLPILHGDADRLAQVLGNLVDNALRHSDMGGKVVLSGAVASDSGGGGVELTVQDDGEGIAVEHLPYIFDRFYRVDSARDRARGGSGIGLAIAKALVEAHDGRITAQSDGPGTGSTFTVTLPTGVAQASTTKTGQ